MKLAQNVFHFLAGVYFQRKWHRFLRQNKTKSIFIFDIDNTLAHTYPTLRQSYPSESVRYLSLKTFPRMQQLTLAIAASPSRRVAFLTARSYKAYASTLQWLLQNGFPASSANLVVVPSAHAKIKLTAEAAQSAPSVWLIDDMSYNHEHGKVKFYEQEIQLLLKLPIKYVGYKTIVRFQNKNT